MPMLREKQRVYLRLVHNEKYWTDPKFRKYEKTRKQEWYQRHKERVKKKALARYYARKESEG